MFVCLCLSFFRMPRTPKFSSGTNLIKLPSKYHTLLLYLRGGIVLGEGVKGKLDEGKWKSWNTELLYCHFLYPPPYFWGWRQPRVSLQLSLSAVVGSLSPFFSMNCHLILCVLNESIFRVTGYHIFLSKRFSLNKHPLFFCYFQLQKMKRKVGDF